jgi:lysylphosphatidylglycerol synthetase-like protein (DUF2156 family)
MAQSRLFFILIRSKSKYELSSEIIIHIISCWRDILIYIIFKNILWIKKNEYKCFDLVFAYFPVVDGDQVVKYFAKMFMFAKYFKYDLVSLRKFKYNFHPVCYDTKNKIFKGFL